MIVTRLSLAGFRNYERFVMEPHPQLTVLVGPNAVGKTNVVEAIQIVTTGSSFRRARWEDVVRWGDAEARVTLRASEGKRRVEISAEIDAEGGKTFRVDGTVKRRMADVAGIVPSVAFTPDDLALVKGSAERRRAAIDDLGEQLSATYGSLRRDYGRVVRHRNALLRDGAPERDIAVWDEQLAGLGGRLVSHRLGLLRRVMERASASYAAMAAGEALDWSYEDRCGLPAGSTDTSAEQAAEAIAAELARRAPEERRRATTLVGPHRDDVVFVVGGREARTFASQGQQRTVALAWKLAELAVIEDVLRTRPILLLDDVMSELDVSRREALRATVAGRTQTIVTTTNLGYFDEEALREASVIELGGAEGDS